ncbi:hypothetical protein PVL29_016973 [Vitis rotundifolia]|uniref:Uncharacterized protein n=1 Tax=Vitis rotundifolia TaxID=103349 RepID=A0AA38Z988_VITRO|nr:hypothetical protein PVL29_016973 [Vitis rotundifolia]
MGNCIEGGYVMQQLHVRREWVERNGEQEGGEYEERNKLKVVGIVMGMVGMKSDW